MSAPRSATKENAPLLVTHGDDDDVLGWNTTTTGQDVSAPLETTLRRGGASAARHAALVVVPYFLSKACIAANTAVIEYYFGQIGGWTLASEGDTLHWEFLWMGGCMGGMRATGLLTARALRSAATVAKPIAARDSEAVDDNADAPRGTLDTCRAALSALFRGPLASATVDDATAVAAGDIRIASMVLTTAYGVVATVTMYNGQWAGLLAAAGTTPGPLLQRAREYGEGFSWGVLPTLWIYNSEQWALGAGASGFAFLYGGVIYAGSATLLAWAWAGTDNPFAGNDGSGARGLGAAMSLGAWIGWAALTAHFWVDPRVRRAAVSASLAPVVAALRAAITGSDDVDGGRRWHTAMAAATAALRRLAAAAVVYLRFAVPLSAANLVGLARGLVTAATITQRGDADAIAYAVSGAFFQTLEIAVLGASSAVTAVVSMADPQATDVAGGRGPRVPTAQARRYFFAAAVTVAVLALAAGALPLLFPRAFGTLFGGSVYAFGGSTVDALQASLIHRFTAINFASYSAAVIGTIFAAALHGVKHVWIPLALSTAANGVGLVYSVVLGRRPVSEVATETVLLSGVLTSTVGMLLFVAYGGWILFASPKAVYRQQQRFE